MTQNGHAFHALTDNVVAYLADRQPIDYYQEPVPSETDEWFDEVLVRFMAAAPEQRETFQMALSHAQRSLFGIYGHRMAMRAVNAPSQEMLLQGLVAAAIVNYEVVEQRRVEVGLVVYHHCARRLKMAPADLFSAAAEYASAEFAPTLRAFGNRNDVVLRRYGWQERLNEAGQIYYKFGLGNG